MKVEIREHEIELIKHLRAGGGGEAVAEYQGERGIWPLG